ncbi:MAG: aminomethyltransferase family protein [Deltaproteobacteria bacterium]|nr:aminomethyltransferase family protein [Deltaproteobacteria bacterium]MBW2398323.1 aminomethyltransferase family protein [Deltaproteobacteria bacterium]
MPRKSPFHARTTELCTSQNWQEWSGYFSADSYALDHMREYNAVRTTAALFDVTPLFKYHVRGRDAGRLLDRVVTRDVPKCREGQVVYTTWCDDDGKIIDDGTLARIGEDAYRLTAAMPTIDWLQDNALGLEVEIDDVTHDFGGLALQGPTSRDLLQQLTGADLGRLPYFHLVEDELAGSPVRISRTGYTGDLGFEIFVETMYAEQVWDAIVDTGRDYNLQPAGNVALDVVRIEAGLLLIDVDFVSSAHTIFEVQKSTPYELGLGWTVKLGKDSFVGRDALREEKTRGPKWATVGLVVDILALEKIYADYSMPLHLPYTSWNCAVPVYAHEEPRDPIGKATSGTWSPILKQYVVIARVDPRHAKPGSRIFLEETVEGRRYPVPAEVVKLPFFDPARKKETLS